MSGKIQSIDSSQFEQEVLAAERAVLDFYSTECPPCEALAAKYELLSELYGDDVKFFKIFRQENKPLAASLGVTSSPTVLFYKKGVLTGDRLTGAVRREDLMRNLDALINDKQVIEKIHAKIQLVETHCDVLILGAGPAGLAAAIYTAQSKLNTLVVDIALAGGQAGITHQVSNYPGFAEPIAGYMLMHTMGEQAKNAGVQFKLAVDVSLVDLKRKKVIVDNYETITAKKIIIATGASPRPLGVKGEKEYKGQGISYCATCDAKYYQDKEVVVIGGGNSAVEESLFISNFARKVTIIHQFDKLQANMTAQQKAFANEKIVFIFQHEPREFIKNGASVNEVMIEDLATHTQRKISCDGVFIFAGMKPNIEAFKEHLQLDDWGYVKTNGTMQTNLPDVYAAGDVVSKPFRQITTSVSDGTIAAMQIAKELCV